MNILSLQKDWPGSVACCQNGVDCKFSAAFQKQQHSRSSDRKGFLSGLRSHFSSPRINFFRVSYLIQLAGMRMTARAIEVVVERQLTVRTVRNCGRRGERGGWGGLAPGAFWFHHRWLLAPPLGTTRTSAVTERLLGGGAVGAATGATNDLHLDLFDLF